jgi:pimeloyl-ACP methyl ester carboxylesterase
LPARPVLVLRGTATDLLPPMWPRRWWRGMIAPCWPVADVGHAPMMDEPDAVEALARFLDGVE